MKKSLLPVFALIPFFFQLSTFAQENDKLTFYVGIGPAIDGNVGNYGLNFSNELMIPLGKRTSIDPSISFFQSISSFDKVQNPENPGDRNNFQNENSSGLFTNVTFKYEPIKTKQGFKVGLAFGPAFHLGSENGYQGGSFIDGIWSHYFGVKKYHQLGFTQQVSVDWKIKKENLTNSATVSMSSFDGYWPWYLMATYRIGFKLK